MFTNRVFNLQNFFLYAYGAIFNFIAMLASTIYQGLIFKFAFSSLFYYLMILGTVCVFYDEDDLTLAGKGCLNI